MMSTQLLSSEEIFKKINLNDQPLPIKRIRTFTNDYFTKLEDNILQKIGDREDLDFIVN